MTKRVFGKWEIYWVVHLVIRVFSSVIAKKALPVGNLDIFLMENSKEGKQRIEFVDCKCKIISVR